MSIYWVPSREQRAKAERLPIFVERDAFKSCLIELIEPADFVFFSDDYLEVIRK